MEDHTLGRGIVGNAEQAVIGGSGRRENTRAQSLGQDKLTKGQEERGWLNTSGIHGSV